MYIDLDMCIDIDILTLQETSTIPHKYCMVDVFRPATFLLFYNILRHVTSSLFYPLIFIIMNYICKRKLKCNDAGDGAMPL